MAVGKASSHFGEAGFVTCFSFYQLLIIAALAREIFIIRKGRIKAKMWKMPCMIWLIVAVGFVFLSIDELVMIHEHTDKLIHKVFLIQETGLTDRIDDFLVACYALLGLMSFYVYREELVKYRKVFPIFIVGYVVTFTMIGLDLLTNRNDILQLFVSNPSFLSGLSHWLGLIEDMLKIIAEGIFIGAFYYCYKIARQISRVSCA